VLEKKQTRPLYEMILAICSPLRKKRISGTTMLICRREQTPFRANTAEMQSEPKLPRANQRAIGHASEKYLRNAVHAFRQTPGKRAFKLCRLQIADDVQASVFTRRQNQSRCARLTQLEKGPFEAALFVVSLVKYTLFKSYQSLSRRIFLSK